MDNEGTTGQPNATDQPGTGTSSEELGTQPVGIGEGEGQPGTGASDAAGEPSGEGLVEGLDLKTLPKQYKDLQREYAQIKDQIKLLEPYGNAEQISQWAAYLQGNPRFQEWVAQEQGRNAMGINEGELEDDQKKALHVVQNIVQQTVDARLNELKKQEIDPIAGKLKDESLEKHFSKMDEKYGPEWRELQDKMGDLSENLPDRVQDNPDFKNVEGLYFQALAESGKLTAYAAKQYEKQLQDKKKKSTEQPTPAAASAPKSARSMAEAFANAKRSVGSV